MRAAVPRTIQSAVCCSECDHGGERHHAFTIVQRAARAQMAAGPGRFLLARGVPEGGGGNGKYSAPVHDNTLDGQGVRREEARGQAPDGDAAALDAQPLKALLDGPEGVPDLCAAGGQREGGGCRPGRPHAATCNANNAMPLHIPAWAAGVC